MRDTSAQLDDLRARLRERDVTVMRLRERVEQLEAELEDCRAGASTGTCDGPARGGPV